MITDTVYQETLDYIYRFVDYSLTHSYPAPEFFDLDRLRAFLSLLGEPHLAFPVIHIAGTKGKGSVAAMCASVLQAAGYRVGLYTSPHMSDYAERIQLNGQPISHAELVAMVDEIRPYLDQGTQLTTFEITTALAFLYFARQAATAVVAEVGLGGRLDATNVVQPIVTVITSLSYDHTSVLGQTLPEIAGEKAGIIKPGVPIIAAPQRDEALQVIRRVADERGAPLIQVGIDYQFKTGEHSLQAQNFYTWMASDAQRMEAYLQSGHAAGWRPLKITIPLLGAHQAENAATAYAALCTARSRGIQVDDEAILAGFAKVYWPGRFEILQAEPPLVIDSAHNRDSARKLGVALDDYFPGRPVILVFGASRDKDISGMLEQLVPHAAQVILTRSYHPRAVEPEQMLDWVRNFDGTIHIVPAVEDALGLALRLVDEHTMVLATGSQFIAAGVRDTWYNQFVTFSG
jgi:dihydrofolate synthase/folylpolyglutamate synthase